MFSHVREFALAHASEALRYEDARGRGAGSRGVEQPTGTEGEAPQERASPYGVSSLLCVAIAGEDALVAHGAFMKSASAEACEIGTVGLA